MNRLAVKLSRFEMAIGPANFSPVGEPVIRKFVGKTPFSVTPANIVITMHDRSCGVYRVRPDREANDGEYVELVVEERISKARPMTEFTDGEILTIVADRAAKRTRRCPRCERPLDEVAKAPSVVWRNAGFLVCDPCAAFVGLPKTAFLEAERIIAMRR
jgi:hypothetical protein